MHRTETISFCRSEGVGRTIQGKVPGDLHRVVSQSGWVVGGAHTNHEEGEDAEE